MGTVKAEMIKHTKSFIKDKCKTIEECKNIIDVDSFKGFSDKTFTQAVRFFMEICPYENPFFEELTFVHSLCIEKEDGYIDFAKEAIHQSLLELKLELNYDFYVELISYLTYKELMEVS